MSRPEDRPILPQTSPMSNFSFAPPNMGIGDNKKNYVFVDEHNRHKRLKVMRACEGCRRRKIKCDAATTNSWPCAACVRLKLQCVPPTVNYNRSQGGGSQGSGLERVLDFADSDASGDEGYGSQSMMHQSYPSLTSHGGYSGNMLDYGHPAFAQPMGSMPLSASDGTFATQATFPPSQQLPSTGGNMPSLERSNSWPSEDLSPNNLSDMLGELKIDEKGMAPYIAQQKKTLAEAPAVEESDFNIPTGPVQPGASVRIPPELMPDDETALEYFEIFFANIYPYMPVISKPFFYQQWHTNRSSISPLLLEAIFACAGRLSDDAGQGIPWLALATKHESSFMDVPRLSTVQGMLLLLKAREGNPKRGYYYRSWMSIKNISAMAKDLELDEHYAIHQQGGNCGSDETECIVKTRIWQTIFISEMMIGGPQGRYDMSVEVDTVDFAAHPTPPGGDDEEYEISRNYVHLARALKNVRTINDAYREIRKNKDWASDPRIVGNNPLFPKWLEQIPPDMQIHFPPDGSAPWLPSHFAGNVHCYYHLSILILHRPQLMACSFGNDSNWKQLMTTCYESAKALCRIQEALLQQFGINGYLVMQRGVNFAIYSVLTCTLIHLTAITSPDPEYNVDAKDYFVRHMRILEQCITAWPMRDLQAQVQSLREAFSANINKPFELKPTFPFGSPVTRLAASPTSESQFTDTHLMSSGSQDLKPNITFNQTAPITPPISAGLESQNIMQQGQRSQPATSQHLGDDGMGQWNPSRLFDQWNTAFGTPTSTVSSGHLQNPGSPSAMYSPTASTVGSGGDMGGDLSGHSPQHFGVPSSMSSAAQMQAASTSFSHQHPQQYVTPSMWQDTVASTYVSNDLKRRWDAVSGNGWGGSDHQQMVSF